MARYCRFIHDHLESTGLPPVPVATLQVVCKSASQQTGKRACSIARASIRVCDTILCGVKRTVQTLYINTVHTATGKRWLHSLLHTATTSRLTSDDPRTPIQTFIAEIK
jgi:hypothetical protein